MEKRLVFVVCLSFLVVAGCGSYKKDLENAKTQIAELTSKNQRLADAVSRLETEKASMMKERDSLTQRSAALAAEVAGLRGDKAELAQKTQALEKKCMNMEGEFNKLRTENNGLKTEIEALKKPRTPAGDPVGKQTNGEGQSPRDSARQPPESAMKVPSSPCGAVLAYMKSARSVVQRYKGQERTLKLEEVRVAYEDKMTKAPSVARKAAEEWVREFSRSWDKTHDDSVIRLLTLKKAVLDGCGIAPGDADW